MDFRRPLTCLRPNEDLEAIFSVEVILEDQRRESAIR